MTMSVSFKQPDFYDDLVDEYEIFEYHRDVVMFMAVLGYVNDSVEREDFRGSGDEQGNNRIETFYSRDLYRVIGSSLAYQDTGDPAALVDLETQAETIAQYAAGGLEVAQEEFGDVAGDPTDALLNYITELEEESGRDEKTILRTIRQNFDDDMLTGESE